MNIISNNSYIRLPTQETERINQISNKQNDTYSQKEISNLIKQLIIFNIFSSLAIITIIVFFCIKLTGPKREVDKEKRLEIYNGLKPKRELKEYISFCIQGKLSNEINISQIIKPKISIIIPIYNKQDYILRILRSIQNQQFQDIEIIFTDDNSKDKSISVIEKYQKKDPRIKLVKHSKNVGTLINRNDGAINSKGEYLLFIDADDMLFNNTLNRIYSLAIEKNVEILQFRAYWGRDLENYFFYEEYGFKHKTSIIEQPELSKLMYYEYEDQNKTIQTEYNLWGKLIKRELFLKVLDNISKYYLNQHMTLHEDGLILFILFKIAKTYLYINEFGMFYLINEEGSLANLRNDENINKTIRDSFLYLKFMFEYTADSYYEKNMAVWQFKFILSQFKYVFYKITNGFEFIYDVIEMYLGCKYINDNDKEIMRKTMYDIELVEMKLKAKI